MQPAGLDADLHKAVGVAVGVVQDHADVLHQLPLDVVGLRGLHHILHALQQLAEGIRLVVGVVADGEIDDRVVGRRDRSLGVVGPHVANLQDVCQLLEAVLGRERRVGVEDVGCNFAFAQVAVVVLLSQRVGALVGRLDGGSQALHAAIVGDRLRRQREQRLHVKRDRHDGHEAHKRDDGALLHDGLVHAQAADLGEILAPVLAALALVFVQHAYAVEDRDRHRHEEHEQDHAGGDPARRGQIRFGDSRDVVHVADCADVAVQRLPAQLGPAQRAVFEHGSVNPAVYGIRAHQRLVWVVFDQVVLGRHRKHEAALPYREVLEHRRGGPGILHELVELLGVLLDHHHRVVVDARRIVAVVP